MIGNLSIQHNHTGDRWFWASPQWARYCAAYGGEVTCNISPNGNLVITLGPEKEMWTRVRHGHQAAIRKAERSVVVSESIEYFDDYEALHEKDAGRKTRSHETFAIMQSFIPQYATLFTALREGHVLASALFFHFRDGVYYASAAKDPDLDSRLSVSHLLVWSAMKTYGASGYRWLDCGPIPEADADPKLLSIAAFKSHFGGEKRVWPY